MVELHAGVDPGLHVAEFKGRDVVFHDRVAQDFFPLLRHPQGAVLNTAERGRDRPVLRKFLHIQLVLHIKPGQAGNIGPPGGGGHAGDNDEAELQRLCRRHDREVHGRERAGKRHRHGAALFYLRLLQHGHDGGRPVRVDAGQLRIDVDRRAGDRGREHADQAGPHRVDDLVDGADVPEAVLLDDLDPLEHVARRLHLFIVKGLLDVDLERFHYHHADDRHDGDHHMDLPGDC